LAQDVPPVLHAGAFAFAGLDKIQNVPVAQDAPKRGRRLR